LNSDYFYNQTSAFKRFLSFSLILITLLLFLFEIFSQNNIIKKVEIDSQSELVKIASENFVGKTIYQINDNELSKLSSLDPSINSIVITSFIDHTLNLKIIFFEKIAIVEDLRRNPLRKMVLLKNGSYVDFDNENLPTVKITNGPVDAGFDGELVSFFSTLGIYELNLENSVFEYNGSEFKGTLLGLELNFGPMIDLGSKAASLKDVFKTDNCLGSIIFQGSDSFISDCNI